jgi:hypothetical protein
MVAAAKHAVTLAVSAMTGLVLRRDRGIDFER